MAQGLDQHSHALFLGHITFRFKEGVADAVDHAQDRGGGNVGLGSVALRHIFKGFSFPYRLVTVDPDKDSGHPYPGQRRLWGEGVGCRPRHNVGLVQLLCRRLTGQAGNDVKSHFCVAGACAGQWVPF